MFFIWGINNKFKELDFSQNVFCNVCGQYGRYNAFVTYMVFTFFFIPIIQFNKKYYVQTSCCSTIYNITKDLGKKIARGEDVTVMEEDILSVEHQGRYTGTFLCPHCNKELDSMFAFCPHCGSKL